MNKLLLGILTIGLTACNPVEGLTSAATQGKVNAEQVKEGKKTIQKVEDTLKESAAKSAESLQKSEE
jgi:hypothetical protein